MRDFVETVFFALGSALTKPSCAACQQALPRDAMFCDACVATVHEGREITYSGSTFSLRVCAASEYGGAVATALNRFKHRDRPDLARPLGDLMRHRVGEIAAGVDVIVPVPLHPVRLAERGYNQSALIARRFAGRTRLCFDTLARIGLTEPQQELSAAARRRNVRAAFTLKRAVTDRHVLLIDDVCTTGATLSACAQTLMAGGARAVSGAVVAYRDVT